jgi:1-deoxy-D-xylulose-5-phosphate synthase
MPSRGEILTLGKGRVLREGNSIAILSLGPRLADALKAADELAARGLPATVADARFAKPLDAALVEQLARHHEVLITIEEGSIGGFGSAVLHHLAWKGLLDRGLKVRPMVLPDVFIDHDSQAKQLAEAKLSAKDIVATALGAIGVGEALPGGACDHGEVGEWFARYPAGLPNHSPEKRQQRAVEPRSTRVCAIMRRHGQPAHHH